MARAYEQLPEQGQHLSLLYIQATEQEYTLLRRAAQRIRRNTRSTDRVFLLDLVCVVVLPETALPSAQLVARRIYTLLADGEFELQILCDNAALALLERVQQDSKLVVVEREGESGRAEDARHGISKDDLPYLAFLPQYPSPRLLLQFPYELACRYHCIPVGAERGVLTLATAQRLSQETVTHFREVTQRNIFQVRCEAGIIEDVLRYWQSALLA